jgi:phosphatidylserine/phosphatidylglycerophosphate/cardiolipin synthase-like enzyme/uncharacterized membrane protein YdjX (TVP38/TMEM64 family)
MGILREDRNCWRVARAARAAVLVDGAAYFAAFREAALGAQHSICIAGWDVDSRTELAPQGAPDGLPGRLGEFLNALCERNRDLHVYVLGWDFAMLYALEREMLPVYSFGWRAHRRLHFHLDDRHAPGGSHHQKIAVVDDALAFVGGIDFALGRWDTPQHAANDAARRLPDDTPYAPFHDVQLMVDGACAAAVAELVRGRWRRATGRVRARHAQAPAPWPSQVASDLEDVAVGIARTAPAWDGEPAVTEVKQLYLDAIAAARRSVYLENQYFTSQAVSNAIEARLRGADAPEFVLVSRKSCDGWLEQETMEVLRARRLRRLRAADPGGRFLACYPEQAGLGEACVRLHSKLMIVDEALLRVGSSNLNNRSLGLDTECDLALQADEPAHERGIARVRARLIAEHLGAKAAQIDIARSPRAAIEALRGGTRTLVDFPAAPPTDPLIPEPELLDPEKPIDAERLATALLPDEERPRAARRIATIAVLLGGIAALAALWRWGPLKDAVDVGALAAWGETMKASPLAPLAIVGGYVAASLVAMPITLLILATAFAFGPLQGFVYAFAGSMFAGVATFWLGRALGRGAVRRVAGKRLNRLSRLLARRGILAVVTVRVLPVAPFTFVNLVAGASQLRARDFLVGTALGMLPGIAAVVAFSDRLAALVFSPTAANLAWLALAVVVIAAAAFALHRWLERRAARD